VLGADADAAARVEAALAEAALAAACAATACSCCSCMRRAAARRSASLSLGETAAADDAFTLLPTDWKCSGTGACTTRHAQQRFDKTSMK
jgi:hypothetical protein